jgi:hypothetical protein
LMVRFSLFNALLALRGEMLHNAIEKFTKECVLFNKNWMQLSGREWSGRFFEATTRLISPGYYIYLGLMIVDCFSLLNEIIKWNFKMEYYKVTWDEIFELVSLPSFNISTIDWTNKSEVQASSVLAKKIRAYAMLIQAKCKDGSIPGSNSLILQPMINEIVKKEQLEGIHKDLRPLIRFLKPDKEAEAIVTYRQSKRNSKSLSTKNLFRKKGILPR